MSVKVGRPNPLGINLIQVGPGLYSLPDDLRARPVKLSDEYKHYTRRMRARGNPIAYLRAFLSTDADS